MGKIQIKIKPKDEIKLDYLYVLYKEDLFALEDLLETNNPKVKGKYKLLNEKEYFVYSNITELINDPELSDGKYIFTFEIENKDKNNLEINFGYFDSEKIYISSDSKVILDGYIENLKKIFCKKAFINYYLPFQYYSIPIFSIIISYIYSQNIFLYNGKILFISVIIFIVYIIMAIMNDFRNYKPNILLFKENRNDISLGTYWKTNKNKIISMIIVGIIVELLNIMPKILVLLTNLIKKKP